MSFYRCHSNFTGSFIDAFGSSLKYLVLDSEEWCSGTDFGDIDFGELTELKIIKETCSRTTSILRTAINLQEVFIDLRRSHAGTAVSQIMKCKHLEYLNVVGSCRIVLDIFQEIWRGLANMIIMNKNKIKIRVKLVGKKWNDVRFQTMLELAFEETVKSIQMIKDFVLIIDSYDAHATWQILKGHIEC